MSLQPVIKHLTRLVACDTQNPPRLISADDGIFAYCAKTVGSSFDIQVWDHGDGRVSWLAVRGKPQILFNVHLDTVPAGEGWSNDPHELVISDERAYGRGSCDIKGAAAVLLEIASHSPDHMAILFTSDEEGAGGCCVSRFVDAGLAEPFTQIVVAEPTSCQPVLGHRGYLSVKTRFHGISGHSSEARALNDSATHDMARWAAAALEVARKKKTAAADPGVCMNIGIVNGGTKSNVIAGEAFVHWSARLRPGESNEHFLEQIKVCAAQPDRVEWEVPFAGEPLPAANMSAEAAEHFCTRHQMNPAANVDFWTEASLFSAAGKPALVLGPGRISEAHQTDEWVALSQLELTIKRYGELVKSDG
ncbi:MAG: acetylornithine deacetylase [Xanthomonadales bacterium]|nr:acetylornithine deacetylase [Xanthomonadales bacterium]